MPDPRKTGAKAFEKKQKELNESRREGLRAFERTARIIDYGEVKRQEDEEDARIRTLNSDDEIVNLKIPEELRIRDEKGYKEKLDHISAQIKREPVHELDSLYAWLPPKEKAFVGAVLKSSISSEMKLRKIGKIVRRDINHSILE